MMSEGSPEAPSRAPHFVAVLVLVHFAGVQKFLPALLESATASWRVEGGRRGHGAPLHIKEAVLPLLPPGVGKGLAAVVDDLLLGANHEAFWDGPSDGVGYSALPC